MSTGLPRAKGCGFTKWMSKAAGDNSHVGAFHLRCKRWSCPHCAALNKKRWIAYTVKRWQSLPAIYVGAMPDDEARRIIKAIRRKGLYRAVIQPKGTVVFASVPFAGSGEFSTDRAIELLDTALDAIPAKVSRPIRGSHLWSLKDCKADGASRWKVEPELNCAGKHVSINQAAAALEYCGVGASPIRGGRGVRSNKPITKVQIKELAHQLMALSSSNCLLPIDKNATSDETPIIIPEICCSRGCQRTVFRR